MSSGAASDAADAQLQAAQQASATQLQMFNQVQQNLQPWMTQGQMALSELSSLMGLPSQTFNQQAYQQALSAYNNPSNSLSPYYPQAQYGQQAGLWDLISQHLGLSPTQQGTPPNPANFMTTVAANPNAPLMQPIPSIQTPTISQFQQSPGYQWQMQQGIDAIQNSAAARGLTGNTLKDLTTFGQGLANQDWWNWYNSNIQNQVQNANIANLNKNNIYNMLYNLSGSGQNAAANLGGFSTTTAQSIANNQIGAGNAQAAGIVGSTGALAGGVNNAMQNYLLYNLMNQNSGLTSAAPSFYNEGVPMWQA
jgi:hypothetical protein